MDRTLTATDLDQHGRDLDTGPVTWTATGGSVDAGARAASSFQKLAGPPRPVGVGLVRSHDLM
jgi:hypothetical protein